MTYTNRHGWKTHQRHSRENAATRPLSSPSPSPLRTMSTVTCTTTPGSDSRRDQQLMTKLRLQRRRRFRKSFRVTTPPATTPTRSRTPSALKPRNLRNLPSHNLSPGTKLKSKTATPRNLSPGTKRQPTAEKVQHLPWAPTPSSALTPPTTPTTTNTTIACSVPSPQLDQLTTQAWQLSPLGMTTMSTMSSAAGTHINTDTATVTISPLSPLYFDPTPTPSTAESTDHPPIPRSTMLTPTTPICRWSRT